MTPGRLARLEEALATLRGRLFVVALSVFSAVLIYRGESGAAAGDGEVARLAAFGYLGITLAGAIALLRAWRGNPTARRVAGLLATLFLLNSGCFAVIDNGLIGPELQVLSAGLLMLFATGLAGAAAVAAAAFRWLRRGGPGSLSAHAVAVAIVAVIAGQVPGNAAPLPPPTPTIGASQPASPTGAPSPTFTASPSPTATPSPTPTATAPPTTPRAIQLAVSPLGTGGGRVTSSPAGIDCSAACQAFFSAGTVVLTPAADQGSEFVGWSEPCKSLGSCTIELTTDTKAVLLFERTVPGGEALPSYPTEQRVRRGDRLGITLSFRNAGTTTWNKGTPGQAQLAQCCPMRTSSRFYPWRGPGWISDALYVAQTQTSVPPGQTADFTVLIDVPKDAKTGTQHADGWEYVLEGVLEIDGRPVKGGTFTIRITVTE